MADSEPGPPPPPAPPPPTPPVPPARQPVPEPEDEGDFFSDLFSGFSGSSEPRTPSGPQGWLRRRKKMRSEMGFFEHLEELRVTLIKSAAAAFIGMVLVSIYFYQIFYILRYPLEATVGPERTKQILMSPLKPTGGATLFMSVSVFGGVLLALPLIAYFVVQFVAPGLTKREKGMVRPVLLSALALFFMGVEVCFVYMMPAAMKFFIWLDENVYVIETHWPIDEYYATIVWGSLAMGLAFEFPLILVVLQVLEILSPATLRSGRRYAIVIMAVVGMLIAPSPDPLSMLAVMGPMLLLYEASIVIGAMLLRRKQAAEARRAADYSG